MGKILIVGQGLAGTSLAELLRERGENIVIVDNNSASAASRVAGGAFNPVVFKRMTQTFNAAKIIPFMREWVQRQEGRYDQKFLYDYPLYKLFSGEEDIAFWKKRVESEDLGVYCDLNPQKNIPFPEVIDMHGAGLVKGAGRVDVKELLSAIRNSLSSEGCVIEEEFVYEDLKVLENGYEWKKAFFDHVVFAEGSQGVENPWFQFVKYRNTKGEVLQLKIDGHIEVMVNKRATVMPLGNGLFKFGATYNWRDLSKGVTNEARDELLERLSKITSIEYEVADHLWGIRPTSHDRRPVVGEHPQRKGMWIFNGLGSKGMMLGPYYAQQLVNLILDNQPVDKEVSVNRYISVEK